MMHAALSAGVSSDASCGLSLGARCRASMALALTIIAGLALAPSALAQESGGEPEAGSAQPAGKPSAASAASTSSADEQAGKALFNRAISAIKDAQSISYMIRTYAEGDSLSQTLPNLQSEVQLARAPGTGVIPGWRVRSTGSGMEPGSMERIEFDVAWLANTVEFVDHSRQTAFEKTARDARRDRPFNIASGAKFDDFTTTRPFQRELASKKHTLEGREDVFGTECDIVMVELPGGMKARWAFGVEDGLPRRVERIITGIMEGRAVTEIQELRTEGADARLTPDLIRITVPEGFKEERPAPKPPQPTTPTPSDGVAVPQPPEMRPSPSDTPSDQEVEGSSKEDRAGEASTAVVATPRVAPTGPATPAIAPLFTLPAASGPDVSLEALRGGYVVLEFSGSWCLPCRDSRPELDQLAKELDGTAKVFTLTVREKSHESAAEEYRKAPVQFGLLFDADSVAEAYAINRFPAFVVVAPDGSVAKVDQNFVKGQTVPGLGTFIRDRIAGIVRPPTPPAAAVVPAMPKPQAADPNAPPKAPPEQTGADE
jgi:thiol-disulfide isomerase/thioredoxin